MRSLENDGWRTVVFVRPGGVYLQSRRAKDLTPYFPDVVAAVRASLPPGTVVDGELVVWDPATGSTVFQGKINAIDSLVLFDVLAAAGENLTGQSLRHRRARLEHLLIDAPPALALCPQTSDIALARIWFDELSVTGSEGLVV